MSRQEGPQDLDAVAVLGESVDEGDDAGGARETVPHCLKARLVVMIAATAARTSAIAPGRRSAPHPVAALKDHHPAIAVGLDHRRVGGLLQA